MRVGEGRQIALLPDPGARPSRPHPRRLAAHRTHAGSGRRSRTFGHRRDISEQHAHERGDRRASAPRRRRPAEAAVLARAFLYALDTNIRDYIWAFGGSQIPYIQPILL